ncbi:uncharacterized protein CLUP02_04729 [Colletotrichum lupini]|uniref:Uncharacterized protein n=1 Tax=Colletotrichum lupini TaxID=145971 RepID=A0A9Q8WE21_9PEZI|nr:uncharacterized protein CLUP02_04729 [Colletotrichum lupini]UQC79250.1 hypothetical protein CLUP02_04729 [Colletotrichum lupini]
MVMELSEDVVSDGRYTRSHLSTPTLSASMTNFPESVLLSLTIIGCVSRSGTQVVEGMSISPSTEDMRPKRGKGRSILHIDLAHAAGGITCHFLIADDND